MLVGRPLRTPQPDAHLLPVDVEEGGEGIRGRRPGSGQIIPAESGGGRFGIRRRPALQIRTGLRFVLSGEAEIALSTMRSARTIAFGSASSSFA